jgi:preprotein translocase subunit YajC
MFSRLSIAALSSLISFDLLAQEAAAQAKAPSPMQGLMMNLPLLILLFAFFYFAVINPQRKQQKQQQEFLSSLKKGDEVIAAGGIIGTISGLTEKVATLEISPDVEIKVLRAQIQGTLKNLVDSAAGATK